MQSNFSQPLIVFWWALPITSGQLRHCGRRMHVDWLIGYRKVSTG